MIRHVCIRVGDWMLENWHLYRYEQTGNTKGTVKWMRWRKVL